MKSPENKNAKNQQLALASKLQDLTDRQAALRRQQEEEEKEKEERPQQARSARRRCPEGKG